MSTFVPVLDTALFTFNYSQADGEMAQNGIWIQRSDDTVWNATELNAVAVELIGWWNEGSDAAHGMKPLTSSLYSLQSVGGRDMTTENSAVIVNTTSLPIAGTGEATAVPQGVSWSATSRTGLAGRNFRGRWFFCGIPANVLTDESTNTVGGTWAAAVVAALEDMQTMLTGLASTYKQVVVSRYSKDANPTPPHNRAAGVVTPIIQWGYHNLLLDFQRRRAPAHNRHH